MEGGERDRGGQGAARTCAFDDRRGEWGGGNVETADAMNGAICYAICI